MSIRDTIQVRFTFRGTEYVVPDAEAHDLTNAIMLARARAMDAVRVKCPTCRCRIMPDEQCACCEDATAMAALDRSLDRRSRKLVD